MWRLIFDNKKPFWFEDAERSENMNEKSISSYSAHISNFISNYIIIYCYINFKRNMNKSKYLYFKKTICIREARLSNAYKITYMCAFLLTFWRSRIAQQSQQFWQSLKPLEHRRTIHRSTYYASYPPSQSGKILTNFSCQISYVFRSSGLKM